MDGYLSRDPARIAENQRARRRRLARIDYMPSRPALAAIENRREQERAGSQAATNSAVLDAIVEEWAELTGIKCREVEAPMTSGHRPELSDRFARAYDFGSQPRRHSAEKCGAKRHRDGQPCEARAEPGKARCRFHGGRSTGPRSAEGKAKALANLRQYRLD